MAAFLLAMYAVFAFVALSNALLMRRPGRRKEGATFCVLIPARDEEENLKRLIPSLRASSPELEIFVFDDESSDATAEVAASAGAAVIQPKEALPLGWTGKNRACHALGRAASERSTAEWMLFLDADTWPGPAFMDSMRDLAAASGKSTGVLTGFPKVMNGRSPEPLFLGWVGWVLLATNPFGLVRACGKGHNRFTNGQIHAWRTQVYTQLWPNEKLKGAVLEDVKIGRLLAREGVKVEVANLSKDFAVKMYDNWREALDGLSKNSYEITDSAWGTAFLGCLMMLIAFGWLAAGHWTLLCLALLLLSGAGAMIVVRARPWGLPLLPIAIAIGGFTIWRSLYWRRRGKVTWKGRNYPY